MASQTFIEFARASAAGEVNLGAGGDTFYCRLLRSNTTVGTQNAGITTLADFTDMDEHGTAGVQTLANQLVRKDDPNNRAEWDADDVTWTALAPDGSARSITGVLICRQAGGGPSTADMPVSWIEFATPKTPDGSDFTIQWNAEGIQYLSVV